MAENAHDILEFSKIFHQYSVRFVRFANRYIRDMSIAEDIVMESFAYWWENRNKISGEVVNVPAYILTSVKNRCLNHIRNEQRRARIQNEIASHNERFLRISQISLDACDPHEVMSGEVQAIFEKALSTLPKHTRDIFVRSRIDNKRNSEIAEELGVTRKHVEFEISKALKVMRRMLKDYGPAVLIYFHMFY